MAGRILVMSETVGEVDADDEAGVGALAETVCVEGAEVLGE